jgi:hypothetical protein
VTAYSFLPWLRRGIASQITGDPGAATRASVPVRLQVTGTPVGGGSPLSTEVSQTVQMYGPGDIIGIDSRAIVRTEPRHWITNFEPNFLAFIEFYEEDFAWRYSPAGPDDARARLLPWVALVVLTEDEFHEIGALPGKPLACVEIGNLDVLPPFAELGAWAHVHVDRTITAGDSEVVSQDMGAVLPRLATVLAENPDLACCRVICPRRLVPNQGYHAFLAPTFETGRLAGLGIDPADAPGALHSSWADYPGRPESGRMPYYHRWFFRTGSAGDFEQLVRLLQPRTLPARVGNRDMDVQRPGAELPGINNPELGGVLRLGGALKVPDTALSPQEAAEAAKYENWDQPYPHPFQRALAALVNLADDYAAAPAADANAAAGSTDPDPMVTPPLYGRWPALTSRLLTDRHGHPLDPDDNWVHELNLDPRFRAAAGLGTRVVQQRQEELMAAAWAQLGEVLEANRRIRAAQLAREVGYVYHARHLQPLAGVSTSRAVAVTAPVLGRVVGEQVTVAYQVAQSRVATAPLSAPMRRTTRPNSRLIRGLPFDPERPPEALLHRIDTGVVAAAPPKQAPPGIVTVDKLEGALRERLTGRATTEAVPDPTDDLPLSPNFVISLPGENVLPRPGTSDSPDAIRFKTALHDAYASFNVADAAGQVPPRAPAGLDSVAATTIAQLDPDLTVPRRTLAALSLPARFHPQVAERFVEAMAYPVFDQPMYEALVALSTEYLLPNIELVPPNSITLVETNQRFIEAYMVGLNHELARELLWREYPTDQRGTPFRQFWDPRTVRAVPGENPAVRKERLRDIPPLHRWPRRSKLGDHDHREAGGAPEDELVLVIRGELLKKYPTAVIYAHLADWRRGPDGGIDPSQERNLAPLTPTEQANPPTSKVRLPLYEAKVDPDITFIGFDLTEEEARGGTGEHPDDEPGWFFVIKERPGEPRFGLDIERSGPLQVWNDLAWPDVAMDPATRYIPVDAGATSHAVSPPDDPDKAEQHAEDIALTWHPAISSADLAYILYQAPVLVAVHAREMLRDG